MTESCQKAIESAPTGTSGLICEPWTLGEVYGVAADWAQASCTVYAYGEQGWIATGQQVADYRHNDRAALADVLAESLRISGEDAESAEQEAASLAEDAMTFQAHAESSGK